MASAPKPEPPAGQPADTQAQIERLSREFDDIKRSLEQLKRIAQPDPAMALVRARRVLEYVVRDLFRRHMHETPGTRPLDVLVTRLVKEEVFDLHIKAYADHIRELGNAATHGDLSKDFSEADAYRALDALLVVLEWYFKKEQIGDIDQLRREVNVDDATVLFYRGRVQQADNVRRAASNWRRYGGLAAVTLLAIILGVVHKLTGIGPPWPPPGATAVAAWLVMIIAWFASDFGVVRDVLPRRAPRALVIAAAAGLLVFFLMLAFFTIPAPTWPNLESRGLALQPAIERDLQQPGRTLEDEFEGTGYNPTAIWIPWTVALVRSIMLVSWLATTAALAALADRLWWLIQESHYDPSLPA